MTRRNMGVHIAGIQLKNPVMTASGTFGSGREYSEFVDLNQLGAVVVKGVANEPWSGNPTPRIAETYGGMLNSVGLQNPGVEAFIKDDIQFLRQYDTKIIVNIAGRTVADYCKVTEKLGDADIDLIELNISCPNVKAGGVNFGTNPAMVEEVTKAVKKVARQPLIVKLTPNVTDIVEIAKAAVAGGADAISLINTLLGMAIDIHGRKPILANVVGGLSGPAIKPVALRMVYQVANAVQVPIIGMGGIATGEDAIAFMLAGATGVAVGTANFMNPRATMEVLEGIEDYMDQYNIEDIHEIIGKL
ncbi:dihydroorotate dehydrogenase [Alkaliphilus oremlandii]|uniref:Dihydroorotate dehydrogenase B (NAD(+)), catalytic subunit n=1 Tax=Alkaliphilus oremlandii (strain OhILAs) TaxID=350688 RepID=PYRDB_ALKOO|nr:dihydroorotate dehydrogenase [Alkaliphilus oremlandii]A8MIU4.1 RecName: Full=Dihydroorotate dehydrogenase B (NAD(+)), catalytic subunit; Short=DHOD B; Short=DHODase B; Short=DHOdehase B; AltName: Full=Dihydroorotate oxidase B; AltName: Full=Orotate reductase (NADH) [Alkaliphilus oremlandii OhILAs]ABW19726.1 dihydroorotate dehydrogenase family protein [Alkaliphilus oremlandii OhILAs]